MKSVENYLHELQDNLCDKIVHDWKNDNRFKNQREMQQYNRGVAEAMGLIREILDRNEFKSPLLRQIEQERR